jgi:hypothetical protein
MYTVLVAVKGMILEVRKYRMFRHGSDKLKIKFRTELII